MRAFRVFRFFSLLAAVYYNFWFGLILFEWGRELWLETDKQKYEVIDILVNMFLIYNCILHFPVMIVNGFIITKELSLEFWQFLFPDNDGDVSNDMAIGWTDMALAMDDSLWFINPWTWISYFLDFFIKWAIEYAIQWFTHDAFAKSS